MDARVVTADEDLGGHTKLDIECLERVRRPKADVLRFLLLNYLESLLGPDVGPSDATAALYPGRQPGHHCRRLPPRCPATTARPSKRSVATTDGDTHPGPGRVS